MSPYFDRSSEYDLKNFPSDFRSNLEIFRMEIQHACTTSSKSNQLRYLNTVRWESGNVATKSWEINNRKSEVIAFVVNAGMNVTANNFYI